MFGLFKKQDKAEAELQCVVVSLNARLRPVHCGERFADLFEEILSEKLAGEVSGGGTSQLVSGEIEGCDLEIQVLNSDEATIALIQSSLESMGVPKRSKITIEKSGAEIAFGQLEGLAFT